MYEQSIKEGLSAEEEFSRLAKLRGFGVKPATGMEQFDHIDFHLTSDEEDGVMTAMVDVKARKRINRNDDNYNDDWLWIEFKNVRGKEGWIYGISDFIAFETIDSFIICYRKELCDWCIDHVDIEEKVTSAEEAEYKAYSRKGKQDLIARVLKEDVIKLPHTQVWKK